MLQWYAPSQPFSWRLTAFKYLLRSWNPGLGKGWVRNKNCWNGVVELWAHPWSHQSMAKFLLVSKSEDSAAGQVFPHQNIPVVLWLLRQRELSSAGKHLTWDFPCVSLAIRYEQTPPPVVRLGMLRLFSCLWRFLEIQQKEWRENWTDYMKIRVTVNSSLKKVKTSAAFTVLDETRSPNVPIRHGADDSHPLSLQQVPKFQFYIFCTGRNTQIHFPHWVFKAGNWIWKN